MFAASPLSRVCLLCLMGVEMSWTVPDDVTDAWIGSDPPGDDAQLQIWIDKAEREIRYRVPDIQSRIDAEGDEVPPRTDLLDSAIDVTVAMVTRVFRNPDGVRQTNETSGPFSSSRTYGGDDPGALVMLDDEVSKLSNAVAGGAFTVDMIPSTSPFAGGASWL